MPDSSSAPSWPPAIRSVRPAGTCSASAIQRIWPERRRENLLGQQIAHWHIVESSGGGYWIAKCDSCGCERRARFDAGQSIPVCRMCGRAAEPGQTMRAAREEANLRAKYLTGGR